MADNPRIEELKRRVQSDPASIAFAALAEEYRRLGEYEEAIATCRAGLLRHPSYLSAHVTLGRALIEVNRFEEAREELDHVLKMAPENLAAIRALEEIEHRRGEVPNDRDGSAPSGASHHGAEGREERSATIAPPPAGVRPHVQPLRVHEASVPVPADPALAELEAFLAAILRARDELETAASDRQ